MALPQTPALTTDCVIFDPVGRVLLIRRKHEPSAGRHAVLRLSGNKAKHTGVLAL